MQHGQSVGIGLPFQHCSFHLNIAETVVGKTGVPRRPSPLPLPKGRGAYRVLIVMLTACLALVTCALWSEFLRNEECNLLTGLAADGDFGESREVLTHVADESSPLDGAFRCLRCGLDGIGQNVIPRLHIVALHNLYWRSCLQAKRSFGSFGIDHRFPCILLLGRFEGGIVALAAVNAVEGNG